jgi:hypothetical protein
MTTPLDDLPVWITIAVIIALSTLALLAAHVLLR